MKFLKLYKNSQFYADDVIHQIRQHSKREMWFHNITVTLIYAGIIFLLITLFSSLASATLQDDFCTELNPNLTVSQCNAYWDTFTANNTIIINNTSTVIQNNTVLLSNGTSYDDTEIFEDLEDIEEDFDKLKNNFSYFYEETNLELETLSLSLQVLQDHANESEDETCDSLCLLERQFEQQLKVQDYEQEIQIKCLSAPNIPLCKEILSTGTVQTTTTTQQNTSSNSASFFEFQKSLGQVEELAKQNEARILQLENSNNDTLSIIAIVISLGTGAYLFFIQKKQKDDAKILDAQRSLETHQERKKQQAKLKELSKERTLYEE
jgi:hypothetical protein